MKRQGSLERKKKMQKKLLKMHKSRNHYCTQVNFKHSYGATRHLHCSLTSIPIASVPRIDSTRQIYPLITMHLRYCISQQAVMRLQ